MLYRSSVLLFQGGRVVGWKGSRKEWTLPGQGQQDAETTRSGKPYPRIPCLQADYFEMKALFVAATSAAMVFFCVEMKETLDGNLIK